MSDFAINKYVANDGQLQAVYKCPNDALSQKLQCKENLP